MNTKTLHDLYKRYEGRAVLYLDNTLHFGVFDLQEERFVEKCASIEEARWSAARRNETLIRLSLEDDE
ncbi:MAG TPA: hypothetical protein DCR21_02860 [Succinivibrionaceae bacterium]|nr:hypothetical protein [Succinivibrionaceae bacterium]